MGRVTTRRESLDITFNTDVQLDGWYGEEGAPPTAARPMPAQTQVRMSAAWWGRAALQASGTRTRGDCNIGPGTLQSNVMALFQTLGYHASLRKYEMSCKTPNSPPPPSPLHPPTQGRGHPSPRGDPKPRGSTEKQPVVGDVLHALRVHGLDRGGGPPVGR